MKITVTIFSIIAFVLGMVYGGCVKHTNQDKEIKLLNQWLSNANNQALEANAELWSMKGQYDAILQGKAIPISGSASDFMKALQALCDAQQKYTPATPAEIVFGTNGGFEYGFDKQQSAFFMRHKF